LARIRAARARIRPARRFSRLAAALSSGVNASVVAACVLLPTWPPDRPEPAGRPVTILSETELERLDAESEAKHTAETVADDARFAAPPPEPAVELAAATAAPPPPSAPPPVPLGPPTTSYWATVRMAIAGRLRYPAEARRQGLEGTVDLRLQLDGTGRLRSANAVSATAPVFADAALRAVRKAAPFGRPPDGDVPALDALLPIRFELLDRAL
jgi:TonB family protein